MKKTKVLVIICTGFVPWGGLTTVAMNYYRAMDKTGLQIDFASNNEAPQVLLDELSGNGSRYYKLPDRKITNALNYAYSVYAIAKGYDVIHIHGNSATMTLELFPAFLAHVPQRLVHCHTSRPTAKHLSRLLLPLFKRLYTESIAVSEEAGDWLFGSGNFLVLNNAIPLEQYRFIQKKRVLMREGLNVDDKTVVYGHIGKIYPPKNHEFLIRVFFEIKKLNANSKLVLVGDGPLHDEVEELVNKLGLTEEVIFVGMQDNSWDWLQAMDCFLFPSVWEGFGLAFAEAQANGLKCFGSEAVSNKALIIRSTEILPLSLGEAEWARRVCESDYGRTSHEEIQASFRKANLDIGIEAEKLKNLYI